MAGRRSAFANTSHKIARTTNAEFEFLHDEPFLENLLALCELYEQSAELPSCSYDVPAGLECKRGRQPCFCRMSPDATRDWPMSQ